MFIPASEAAIKAATSAAASANVFRPRQVFEVSSSINRSYFLGHHNAALSRMRRVLSNVGLVIECRDMRVPLSSWNPLLETSLMYGSGQYGQTSGSKPAFSSGLNAGGRARIIVYTKRDLVSEAEGNRIMAKLENFHRRETNTGVLFHGAGTETRDTKNLLKEIKKIARYHHSLTGLRGLVVGMPNAGKSTLLNRLRGQGKSTPGGSSNVARTGAEPGVTRKIGTPVRIIASDEDSEGVFVLDTPGVFVPYVPDPEAMLKLTLAGCVKDGLISWITVADFLLYHLNLYDPTGEIYREYCDQPTNDVHQFLSGVARRTGKLLKGSEESLEGAANWIVRRWRNGLLGNFVLDKVTDETMAEARRLSMEPPLSLNQAKKRDKEARKERTAAKHSQKIGTDYFD